MNDADSSSYIHVHLGQQTLCLHSGPVVVRHYQVSTARNGPGERAGSECTPRGWHRIAARIGEGAALHTVFVGRKPTGERWSPEFAASHPGRDWILTRILWLEGTEPGRNQGGDCDTFSRYIYLHGTPDDVVLGIPGSRGCVRMRGSDIIDLHDRVQVGCRVLLSED